MTGMMKKAMLLGMLTLTLASPVFAADWKHLGSDGKGNHYFYKPKTYAISKDNIISSWTKVEHKVDEAGMAQKKTALDDYVGDSTTIVYEQFKCADRKKMTVIGKHYHGIDENDMHKTGWLAVQKGSTDEGLLTALCSEPIAKKDLNKTPAK